MAKLRKVLDFFVTIDDGEDEKAPAKPTPPPVPSQAEAAPEPTTRVRDLHRSGSEQTLGEEFNEEDYDLSDLEAELSSEYDAGGGAGGSGAGYGDGPLIVRGIDEVYHALGLPARDSEDFTIFTLMDLLASDYLKGLPAATKRASLMVAMQARDVEVGDVIADAIHRDQALDMYDAELSEQLQSIEEETSLKNEELQEKMRQVMEEIRAGIEENNLALDSARESYQQWRVVKQEEEQNLFDAVDPFVESGTDNEITVDN